MSKFRFRQTPEGWLCLAVVTKNRMRPTHIRFRFYRSGLRSFIAGFAELLEKHPNVTEATRRVHGAGSVPELPSPEFIRSLLL